MRVSIVSSIVSAAGLAIAFARTSGISIRNLNIDQISSSEHSLPILLRRTERQNSKSATGSLPPSRMSDTLPSPNTSTPRASQHRLGSSPFTSPITPAQRVPKRKTTSSAQEIPPGKSLSPDTRPSGLAHSPGSAQLLHDVIKTEWSPPPRSRSPSPHRSPSPPMLFTPGGRALARQGSNKTMYKAYNRFRGDSPGPLGLNPARVSASDLHGIGLQLVNSPPTSRDSSPVRASSSSGRSSSSRQQAPLGLPSSPSPDPSISDISARRSSPVQAPENQQVDVTSRDSIMSSPVGRITQKFQRTGLQSSDRQHSAPF